ncbi:MAG: hypothetical protein KAQ93_04795 [Spirochaetales bacterium]|nr:hypothetical protein [Spirochaetales bacterium]
MKKILLILLILTAATVMVHSEGIELGDFPIGKWLDANWDAVWEFETNNIRILSTDGSVHYDFDGKTIKDWKVRPGTKGLVLSFYCKETGKKYEFTKPLTNLNLLMKIDTDTGNSYSVELPLEK